MLWGSLFPYHVSQPKIRSTVLNWGVGLLAGTLGRNLMLKLNFNAFEVDLFYFKFCFLEGGSCIFSPSLELTIGAGSTVPGNLYSSSLVVPFSSTESTICYSSPKPWLPGWAAPWGFPPGTSRQHHATHVLRQQMLMEGCGSCRLPWYTYAMLQLHWGPSRYACPCFLLLLENPFQQASLPPYHLPCCTTVMLMVRGHKHLHATHVQLRQRWAHSENPVSKSNRALLASAQHSCTRSHTRHLAPQITLMKSTQGAGQGRFYRGDQTAGSNSYPRL